MVEFDADFDLDQALLDTREAVNRAKVEFPSDAEEPIIQEQSTSEFPILQVNLVGDVPERMLYNIALIFATPSRRSQVSCRQTCPANVKS